MKVITESDVAKELWKEARRKVQLYTQADMTDCLNREDIMLSLLKEDDITANVVNGIFKSQCCTPRCNFCLEQCERIFSHTYTNQMAEVHFFSKNVSICGKCALQALTQLDSD